MLATRTLLSALADVFTVCVVADSLLHNNRIWHGGSDGQPSDLLRAVTLHITLFLTVLTTQVCMYVCHFSSYRYITDSAACTTVCKPCDIRTLYAQPQAAY